MQPRLTLNLELSCLSLFGSGVSGTHCHVILQWIPLSYSLVTLMWPPIALATKINLMTNLMTKSFEYFLYRGKSFFLRPLKVSVSCYWENTYSILLNVCNFSLGCLCQSIAAFAMQGPPSSHMLTHVNSAWHPNSSHHATCSDENNIECIFTCWSVIWNLPTDFV